VNIMEIIQVQYKIKSFVHNIFNCIFLPNICVARCCTIVINIILLSTLTVHVCPHSTHQILDPKVFFIVVREVSIENDMID